MNFPLLPPHVRARIALLAVLFIALHAELLYRLFHFARTDADWSHAFLVPLISVYLIYHQRDALRRRSPRTWWWGLAIFIPALAGYFVSIYPLRNVMLQGYFMVLELLGLTLLLTGAAMARLLWFPVVYLAFAVRITPGIWSAVAWRLQLLAARSAVSLLNLLGVESAVSTTSILLRPDGELVGVLRVAQACSGMRMIMAFLALGAAVAYLMKWTWWARVALVAAVVPITIAANIARVLVLSLLFLIDPGLAQGAFHILIGMAMLVPALALFLLVTWALGKIAEK